MSRNPLVIAVGRVAWGYVFFYCALPFGYMNYATIDLMPDWAFYAFALAAIPAIARRVRSIKALAAVSAVLATLSTLPLPVDRLDEYDAGGLVMVIVLVWAIMLTWTLFTLTGLHGELRRAMPEDDIKEDGE